MSLTVHKLGLAILRRIGVTSYDPSDNASNTNRRGLLTGDLDEALVAINGAMEECFALGPTELSEKRLADTLRAPTDVTLNVTQYSATVASLTTFASWMQGCTIRIAGDTGDNQIVSSTALLRPFMGASGTGVAATVYADAVPVSNTVFKVMGPVEIPPGSNLCPVGSREEFEAAGGYATQTRPTGQPGVWFADTAYLATNAFTQIFLRVSPMPLQAYSLSYRAKMKPPTYVQTDFYASTTYGTDPGTVIPFDWAESTLLPIALQRFTSHPAFDSPQAIPEIARQAELARLAFQAATPPMSAPRQAVYR